MAWNSHGRQIKTIESVVKYRKELEHSTADHVLIETELRFGNFFSYFILAFFTLVENPSIFVNINPDWEDVDSLVFSPENLRILT